jgi:photosystem II stability/assembly factor-like uncharacterized protein
MNRFFSVLFFLLIACSTKEGLSIETLLQNSQTTSLLQAISIVDENIAWVSGHGATFCRTIDGGTSWEVFTHPADSLQFRDLHAFNENEVILMSAGPGAASRIFKYNYQSSEFSEMYVMPHPEGFLNTIEFWDNTHGLAFGDSFGGALFVLKTQDGGSTWDRIDPRKLPPAGQGEGGFAASGTCIATQAEGKALIGTGAGGHSRILITFDYGETWTETTSPLVTGDAAGIFSIRIKGNKGLIVGGDLSKQDAYMPNTAVSTDGGLNWTLTSRAASKGTFYGSDFITSPHEVMMACGPAGIDVSTDFGKQWNTLDSASYWALDLHESGFGFAVGPEGKILKININ